jgi:signal transduction histidine kinase
MRRRIVRVAVVAALVALAVLAVPLAVAVHRLYVSQERSELERLALRAAVVIDPSALRRRVVMPAVEPGEALGVYGPDGRKVSGAGPAQADAAVRQSLTGRVVQGSVPGRVVVALPVLENDSVSAVVRAAAPTADVWRRTALTGLGIAGLAVLALLAAVAVARRQATLLAAPIQRLVGLAQALGDGNFAARVGPSGIGEVDRVAAALGSTADRLEGLLSRERTLADDASHQLRTPLTGLQLGLESALAGPEAELRPALDAALHAARRLGQTIDDLLTLRHPPPARQQHASLAPADLAAGVRDRWEQACQSAGRLLGIRQDHDAPSASASPEAVRQVLDVLLDNALKHGRGPIQVRLRDAGGALGIDVADAGAVALPPEQLFRRGSSTGGTGIGLALAASLAQAEGGRLVLSHPDPTVFTVLLPVQAEPEPRPAPPPPRP